VTVNGESFSKSWGYNHSNGFLEAEIDYSITTAFGSDGLGNVGSVTTANGKTTTSTYQWGIVKDTRTAEFTVTRSINSDGTVASETRAGRTSTFAYDALSRVLTNQPPGGTNVIQTDYDNSGGAWVKVTRGSSVTTTSLDGVGRPIATENSLGVKTSTAYDAEGRKTYEGYPFQPSRGFVDKGTRITGYDGLGRVTQRTNPDGSTVDYTYGDGTVTVCDENTSPRRCTTQTRQAFGTPDDARLAAVTDALGNTWSYSYNALGKLLTVTAPAGGEAIVRAWRYNTTTNLLDLETQPESGTVGYVYDAAGVVAQRTDAKGTVFTYTYDGNDRLKTMTGGGQTTSITYEAGSDNRASASVGSVTTTFEYDNAGRLRKRDDVIDGQAYTRVFGYDGNDNLTSIKYPSGRDVHFEYDSENRLLKVVDDTAARNVATNFIYHPSGAIASYTSGNGIANTVTYDPDRYWPRSIAAGALGLTYDTYDGVGNVLAIGDSRPGMGQTFGYDSLDRLTSANGPYGGVTYAYDAHGNRTNGYTYVPGTLRLQTAPSGSFGYDNNGNMTSAPNATFTYTPDNMLQTASTTRGTATYKYDADGWRAKKESSDGVSFFLRGLHGELLTEFHNPNTSGATIRDYVYAGSRLLGVVTVP
jgi:YD repeat-containing protein